MASHELLLTNHDFTLGKRRVDALLDRYAEYGGRTKRQLSEMVLADMRRHFERHPTQQFVVLLYLAHLNSDIASSSKDLVHRCKEWYEQYKPEIGEIEQEYMSWIQEFAFDDKRAVV